MGRRTCLFATGFHCKIGSADPETESESGALPWCVRTEQTLARSGDQVTPGGKGNKSDIQTEEEEEEGKAKRRGMSWAQRLKRVFGIDVEVCPHCGGGVRIIACIEDPVVIRQILSHVETKQEQANELLPRSRAATVRVIWVD